MPIKNRFFHANTDYGTYNKHISSPMLRHKFKATDGKAVIKITGLGFYRLFLNGEDITRGELAPYISNPDHYVYVDEYNVTELLNKGDNAVGIILGNGMQNIDSPFWEFKDNTFRSAPKFAFSLEINGEELFDAGSFVWHESPYYYDDLRSGVFYDARCELDGWCKPEFDDNDWKNVTAAERVRGEIRTKVSPNVTVYDEKSPISIRKGDLCPVYTPSNQFDLGGPYPETEQSHTNGYIFDFGVNSAAIFRLKVKGECGQKISLQFCEALDKEGRPHYNNIGFYPDGYVQRDIYICKGEGEEIFVPAFTYHGYRYCYVTGINENQATSDLITMLRISNNIDLTGTFSCSDENVNKIQAMVVNSDLSNIVHFPTDCPQREKHGWTGDATVSAEQMLLNFDMVSTWREWLYNIRKAQKENGQIPGIVPTESWGYEWGNGPIWDNVLFELPFLTYKYYGDETLIRENATAMFRYLHYADKQRRDDGLLSYGLGDWAQVNPARRMKDAEGGTNQSGEFVDVASTKAPREFVDTAAIYDACKKATLMFNVIGYKKEAEYSECLANELLTALRNRCINHYSATAMGRCQTTQAIAITLGIFEESEMCEAGRVLEKIVVDDGECFDCGFYGLRNIFHALSLTGRSELAFKLIMRDAYPSYKYLSDEGFTSLPEDFKPNFPSSHNHHFLGDVSHWFYRHLGGINVNPHNDDADYIEISPQFLEKISHASVSKQLRSGKIDVSWKRCDDGRIKVSVHSDGKLNIKFIVPSGYAVDCYGNAGIDEKRELDTVPSEFFVKKWECSAN